MTGGLEIHRMSRPADPNSRNALIAAALAEFLKKGIRAARIEDITAACGLSKGAFYLHFESKEALFRERVTAFQEATNRLTASRMTAIQRFIAEHGMLEARDFDQRTDRYERLLALETEHDLEALEVMWAHRHAMNVLISGSAGTEFEGLVWQMVDREVQRVADNFRGLQETCACRTDIPPELFGSLIVGTYLLIGKQMSREAVKPNLAALSRSLQRLIREGTSPKYEIASQAPALRPARSRSAHHPAPPPSRRPVRWRTKKHRSLIRSMPRK